MHACINITDLSSLKDVSSLTISYCNNINNLSHLYNLNYLYVLGSNNITDLSPLLKYNLKNFICKFCYNIKDFSPVVNVKDTRFEYCEKELDEYEDF